MNSKNKPVLPSAEQLRAKMLDDERRDHGRKIADGQVLILFSNPVVSAVEGDLQDVSEGGFRVRHGERQLVSGLQVRFCWRDCTGTAVVAWTRLHGKQLESGFSIKERQPLA